jgi:hypothetical protein
MRRALAIALAGACLVGAATSAIARNTGHVGHHVGRVHNSTILLAPSAPRAHFGNRIPAPLAEPTPAPTINGPISQPAFRGLTGIGQ